MMPTSDKSNKRKIKIFQFFNEPFDTAYVAEVTRENIDEILSVAVE